MESEDSFKSNLVSVKELILDDEKIVTYVSLSKDLCIHINNSKKLLHTITKKLPEEHPHVKLNVNYIISGITDDNKARITVCADDELEQLKLKFKTIFFEHVYSVSKGSSCADRAAYLLLNKFDDFNLCTGSVKGTECIKRSSDEIGNLKNNSRQDLSNGSKELDIPQKKIKTETKNVPNLIKYNKQENKSPDKAEVGIKIESNIKSEEVSPKKEANHNKQIIKSNTHKTQKGIAGFFNSSNAVSNKKKLKETEIKVETKHTESIKDEEEKMEVDDSCKQESDKDIKKEPDSNKKNKTVKQIKKTSKVDKKRKRVLQVSDSDTDEENDPFIDKKETKVESDDEIPATPTVNCIKITSGIVNPKKRRKIVDKTYTDEEGYVLTKKEEVFVSCSENEDDVKGKENIKEVKWEKIEISPKDEKKNGTKSTKKKISPPQKGKQATLAHFFKKKEQ